MPTVVLSTGRCGTQWLTDTLGSLYPDELIVEHEPIGPLYRPRRCFRCYERPDAVLDVPEVRAHIDWIGALDRPYVETGWPLFAALPLLAERYGGELAVVHLTRHPVPSALSHLAHNSYAGSGRDDDFTRLATLGPSDPNVFQAGYSERWDRLSPYEKCLYWITEVGMFGLEFEQRYPQVRFLRVRSEDMLAGDRATLEGIARLIGVEFDERWPQMTSKRVDRWHHHTDLDVDPLQIEHHPLAMSTARRLGYEPTAFDAEALRARYAGEPDPGLDRFARKAPQPQR